MFKRGTPVGNDDAGYRKASLLCRRHPHRARPPRDAAAQTRRKLMLSAVSLGAECDFSKVALREIVENAGCLNTSAIHYHFRSRAGLLRYMTNTIDTHWPCQVTKDAPANIKSILKDFLLCLEHLKQSEDWHDTVVPFIVRLANDKSAVSSNYALALLSRRLKAVFNAVKPFCPDVPDRLLRLRISSACLLLMSLSAKMNLRYLTALDQHISHHAVADQLGYAVDIACSIVRGDHDGASDRTLPVPLRRHF